MRITGRASVLFFALLTAGLCRVRVEMTLFLRVAGKHVGALSAGGKLS